MYRARRRTPIAGLGQGQQVGGREMAVLERRPDPDVVLEPDPPDAVEPVQRGRRAARERVGLALEVDDPVAPRELPAARVAVADPVARLVEQHHARRHDLDIGVRPGERVGRLEEAAVEHVVGVGERHPLAARVAQAGVAGRSLPGVRLVEHRDPQPRPVAPRLEHRPRAVGGPVVDGDDLQPAVIEGLALDRVDELLEVRRDVVDGRDDREPGTSRLVRRSPEHRVACGGARHRVRGKPRSTVLVAGSGQRDVTTLDRV